MTHKLYKCTKCNYQKKTIAGFGRCADQETRTCVCDRRKILVEVTTKAWDVPWDPEKYFQSLVNLCPYCHDEKYHIWPASHPCPKCSAKMICPEIEEQKEWDKIRKHNKGLYIAIVFDEKESGFYDAYIINDSSNHYTSVEDIVGGNIPQDDDPPAPMGIAENSLGVLKPHSFLHVETNHIDMLDYRLWTHFLFTPEKGKPFKRWYEIGGTFYYSNYEGSSEMIPILNKVGVIEELRDLK